MHHDFTQSPSQSDDSKRIKTEQYYDLSKLVKQHFCLRVW